MFHKTLTKLFRLFIFHEQGAFSADGLQQLLLQQQVREGGLVGGGVVENVRGNTSVT